MGAAQSINSTEIVNKSLTDIVLDNSSKCKAEQGSKQTMIFGPITSDGCAVKISNISQDSKLTQNFSCINNITQNTDIINQISTKLKQDAEAKTSGVNLFNFSASANINKAVNEVKNNINIKNVTECIASNLSEQNFGQGAINIKCYPWMPEKERVVDINNISQSIVSTQVANCLNDNKQTMQALNKFDSDVQQTATSSAVGLGAIASGISLCCLIVLAIVFFLIMSSDGSSGGGGSAGISLNIDPATAMKYGKYMV